MMVYPNLYEGDPALSPQGPRPRALSLGTRPYVFHGVPALFADFSRLVFENLGVKL